MSKKLFGVLNGLKGILANEESMKLFSNCMLELSGHIDSIISSLGEDEADLVEYYDKMGTLVERIENLVNQEDIPMFKPAFTMEYLKENNIDVNKITGIRVYFDILVRFQEGLATLIGLKVEGEEYTIDHDEGVEAFLYNDEYGFLDEYLRNGNHVTMDDVFTYFGNDVLEILKKNNVKIITDDGEYNINDVDNYQIIETGESYDS